MFNRRAVEMLERAFGIGGTVIAGVVGAAGLSAGQKVACLREAMEKSPEAFRGEALQRLTAGMTENSLERVRVRFALLKINSLYFNFENEFTLFLQEARAEGTLEQLQSLLRERIQVHIDNLLRIVAIETASVSRQHSANRFMALFHRARVVSVNPITLEEATRLERDEAARLERDREYNERMDELAIIAGFGRY